MPAHTRACVTLARATARFCSLSLSGARIQSQGIGAVHEQEIMYIKGSSIRYVHLPEDVAAEKIFLSKVRSHVHAICNSPFHGVRDLCSLMFPTMIAEARGPRQLCVHQKDQEAIRAFYFTGEACSYCERVRDRDTFGDRRLNLLTFRIRELLLSGWYNGNALRS